MHFQTLSYNAVMLYFDNAINEQVLDKVSEVYQKLKSLGHLHNLTPSYSSIMIEYNFHHYNTTSIQEAVLHHIQHTSTKKEKKQHKEIKIPVDYAQGIDLERIAKHNAINVEEVIKRHTQMVYRVYAIGFLEGFAYLARVDEKIKTPRLSTPRDKVPKGSVAIADYQTAIYPENSAGGWNIIGHTSFEDFSSFEVGDSVRFVRV